MVTKADVLQLLTLHQISAPAGVSPRPCTRNRDRQQQHPYLFMRHCRYSLVSSRHLECFPNARMHDKKSCGDMPREQRGTWRDTCAVLYLHCLFTLPMVVQREAALDCPSARKRHTHTQRAAYTQTKHVLGGVGATLRAVFIASLARQCCHSIRSNLAGISTPSRSCCVLMVVVRRAWRAARFAAGVLSGARRRLAPWR